MFLRCFGIDVEICNIEIKKITLSCCLFSVLASRLYSSSKYIAPTICFMATCFSPLILLSVLLGRLWLHWTYLLIENNPHTSKSLTNMDLIFLLFNKHNSVLIWTWFSYIHFGGQTTLILSHLPSQKYLSWLYKMPIRNWHSSAQASFGFSLTQPAFTKCLLLPRYWVKLV